MSSWIAYFKSIFPYYETMLPWNEAGIEFILEQAGRGPGVRLRQAQAKLAYVAWPEGRPVGL